MNVNNHHLFGLCALLVGWSGLIQAQTSLNAAGGDAAGSGGTVAYSLGQVVYTTHTDPSGSMAQGVQHAYEIFTVGQAEINPDISLTAFPNPTTKGLTLQISRRYDQELSYQLIDMQGKLLKEGRARERETHLKMGNLPTGTYLVMVLNKSGQNLKTFKIIKEKQP